MRTDATDQWIRRCRQQVWRRAVATCFVTNLIVVIGGALTHAEVQQFVPPPPPAPPPPPPPVFNPSTPYTVPSVNEKPVSPGLPSKLPDSSFCSVFDLGPCFPQFLPPIGQDLRLTIVSTDDKDAVTRSNAGANKSVNDTDATAHEKSWIRSANCMPHYAHAGRRLRFFPYSGGLASMKWVSGASLHGSNCA